MVRLIITFSWTTLSWGQIQEDNPCHWWKIDIFTKFMQIIPARNLIFKLQNIDWENATETKNCDNERLDYFLLWRVETINEKCGESCATSSTIAGRCGFFRRISWAQPVDCFFLSIRWCAGAFFTAVKLQCKEKKNFTTLVFDRRCQ